ncbi:MAG: M28 family metallopeptidase [Vicinamibacterales bacterium]
MPMLRASRLIAAAVAFTALATACGRNEPAQPQAAPPAAAAQTSNGALPPPSVPLASLPKIDGASILKTTTEMSSDKFQGRGPGTAGEDLTVAFLEAQFKELGLQPGNPDGSYIQKVPLVGITGAQSKPLTFSKGTHTLPLKWKDEVVAWSRRVAPAAAVAGSDVIFAGYGVDAPEFNWNDFKDVDVKGKTIIVLVNDPPVPDPANAAALDPKTFGGKAMTYYGRWTYKFEEGARKGAAAVLIVHETGPAGYPFSVVQGNLNEKFDLVAPDKNMGKASIEGWITLDAAKKLFAMGGQDYDVLKQQALTREFKPVPLGVKASVAVSNKLRTIDSRNVIARLEGSDPVLKDEYVVYSAHWDHLGVGAPVNGDRIYNGALDNASGVATVLEIARALKQVQPQPKRSFLFLMVTAEEKGLIGSEYYSLNPLYPLAKTVANINIDGVNQWGRTKDISVVGLGASELDDYLRQAAQEQGRTITPDAEPEKGFYYRSDHFNFAKQGVPALDPDSGIDYVGRSAEWGKAKRDEYTEKDYHAPSDQVKPDWDLTGAIDDAQLLMAVGYRVANADRMPEWRPGNEFKAKRDAMLKK